MAHRPCNDGVPGSSLDGTFVACPPSLVSLSLYLQSLSAASTLRLGKAQADTDKVTQPDRELEIDRLKHSL